MEEYNSYGKVSIVLPVYNGESNISNAISSVLRQSYRNFELIIVNDCSTDGTIRILEKYAMQDSRIKIFSNTVNLKLPASLNVGFKNATGEFYTWTSDDNLYKENAIEKMVETLRENPDYDMVYANYTQIDEANNILGKARLDAPNKLIIGNVIGACFLYTSRVAKQVGEYDVNLFLAEDYDYWMRILRIGKIIHINDNLYYYRHHAGSLSETKKKWIGMQTYKALEKNFLYMYSFARTRKDKYALFDQMIFRVDGIRKIHVETLLYNIDKNYRIYKRNKKVKDNLFRVIDTIKKYLIKFF